MKKENFNIALNHIDYDLVEEYVAEKDKMQKRVVQRRTFMKLAPIAACFVLIITFSITVLPMILNNSFDNAISSSPIDESFQDPPTTEDTSGSPEENEPEYEGVAPMPPSDALGSIYTYTFQYEDVVYILKFNSLEELNKQAVSEDKRGEYIATVSVYDSVNDKETLCAIYECAETDDVIIELLDGYYFVVE